MSDIQDPLSVLQRRMQQRQILAMMGIDQWVQPESKTITIEDIAASPKYQSNTDHPTIELTSDQSRNTESKNTDLTNAGSIDIVDPSLMDYGTDSSDIVSSDITSYDDISSDNDISSDFNGRDDGVPQASVQNPVTYSFDTLSEYDNTSSYDDTSSIETDRLAINEIEQSTTEPVARHSFAQGSNNDAGSKKVAPFNLQGGRYGDWVILVDIQALSSDSQKLWQNITQALSLTHETTSFPICAGMDTAELANASLAGYIFRIGLREEIQVAALTALPDGLYHPNLTIVPTLDDMLADSDAKRKLWEQISS